MKIAVTGSAGHLARALLPALCAWPQATEVTGLDARLTRFRHARFRAIRADLRQSGLAPLVTGHDALIHLAFIVQRGDLGWRRRNREHMRRINLETTEAAADLALAAGLRHFIFLSSVAVYGAWPDNPRALSERSPLRPNPGFAYAEDKAAAETLLRERLDGSGIRLTILRPHAILGPDAQPLLLRLLAQPWMPRLGPPEPMTQCIWQDDVVRAMLRTLQTGAEGAFNLAAEPAMSLPEMKRHLHRRPHAIPYGALRLMHRLQWQLTGRAGEPGWMDALRHSLVVDSTRARRELGWQPHADIPACLDAIRHHLRRKRAGAT